MKQVRTRFAPSPTGFLHVGGLRTALYAYLLAKKHGGQFVLRIEDTDKTREVVGGTENIIKTLHWAGIDVDEGPVNGGPYGPYIQSERLPLYQKHALDLVEADHAYYCFCSPERLERVRALQMANKQPPAYDQHCRHLSAEEVVTRLRAREPHVIRMKIPVAGEIVCNDLIRGPVTFSYKVVDDQVIIKSDGFPTYHLAVVVDDHYMHISHVLRGEEWLSSTPKHLLLYHYFGWEAPEFAHLPLLLNPDHSKLSKRQGDVAVEDYQNKGYLPEALINFIAFLGWNPGDTREIFSLEELVKEFSVERVGKAGAVFNVEKLNWLNHYYIQHMPIEALLERVRPLFQEKGWTDRGDDYLKAFISLFKERATVLPDFLDGTYFFETPTKYDEKSWEKNWKPETAGYIKELLGVFEQLEQFDAATLEHATHEYSAGKGLKPTALLLPLRLAVSGVGQGPAVFQIMALIGKEETLKRIRAACARG